MKRILSVFLSLMLLLVGVVSPISVEAKTTISTPETSLTFVKGASNNLVIYVNGNRAGGGTVSFKSSDKAVASVDSNGKVTAKGVGSASITVRVKKDTSIKKVIKIKVVSSKSFSVTPSSAPLNGAFLNFSTYNSKTKNYYTVRSYLEYFEKHSDCILNIKKGTYSVTNVLYVPNYATIKLADGVVINKTSSTGTSALTASSTLFAFCAPSKSATKGAYEKYNGVHDAAIKGSGTATINMKNAQSGKISVAIVMCHNKNVSVSGIKFTNMKYGHFIEMDASKNVKIRNCEFKNQLDSKANSPSECINIDTPDSKTNGFNQNWAKNDSYPNDTVVIDNCSFYNVQRAIGTHQYSQNKYHKNITIKNCSMKKFFYGGVYMMNWKDSSMINNSFNGIGKDLEGNVLNKSYIESDRAFLLAGCSGIKIKDNSFKNCFQIGAITSHQANGYPMIYNNITADEFNQIQTTNKALNNIDRPFVRAYANWDGKNSSYCDYYVG